MTPVPGVDACQCKRWCEWWCKEREGRGQAAADWDLWERLLTAGLPVESRTDMAFTL